MATCALSAAAAPACREWLALCMAASAGVVRWQWLALAAHPCRDCPSLPEQRIAPPAGHSAVIRGCSGLRRAGQPPCDCSCRPCTASLGPCHSTFWPANLPEAASHTMHRMSRLPHNNTSLFVMQLAGASRPERAPYSGPVFDGSLSNAGQSIGRPQEQPRWPQQDQGLGTECL